MTTNEQIAKVMGWEFILNAYEFNGVRHWGYVDKNGAPVGTKSFDPGKYIDHAKLLQQRMVDDGWLLKMLTNHDKEYALFATRNSCEGVYLEGCWKKKEPAAIVSLFCKVYEIKEEA